MKLGKLTKLGLLMASASFITSPLLAGSHSLKLTSRFDHNYIIPSFGDTSKEFRINRVQLDFKGSLPVEGMTYRVRPRISKLQDATNGSGSAGVQNDIDYAYVTKDFGNNLSLSAGKIFVQTGGWENDYGGENQYSFSLAGDGFRGYGNGAELKYKVMGHSIGFQVLNASATETGTSSVNGKRYAKGLYWQGNFMDGMVKTILTYHLDPTVGPLDGTNGAEVNTKDLSFGVQLNVSKIKFELDYLTVNAEGQAGTFAQPADTETTSIVAQMHYSCGKWTPYFKYAIDEQTSKTTALLDTKQERTVMDLGVEYNLAKGHRLHLIYSSTDTDWDNNGVISLSGEDSKTETIRLGYKLAVGIF